MTKAKKKQIISSVLAIIGIVAIIIYFIPGQVADVVASAGGPSGPDFVDQLKFVSIGIFLVVAGLAFLFSGLLTWPFLVIGILLVAFGAFIISSTFSGKKGLG